MLYTKLKYIFETLELDDVLIAIPVGEGINEFHKVIKLNETAAFIFNLLQEEMTEEQIVNAILGEYDAPKEVVERDVHKYLENFKERGVLI